MTGIDLYDSVSLASAKQLTLRYSSSFGLASRLFASAIRPHIYAIYGMVRVADEIVDTHTGSNRAALLERFRADVRASLTTPFSPNPIAQAFGITARAFGIGTELIDPFFESMRLDLDHTRFTQHEYERYIYGSAEVIGLMCLKVFCDGDDKVYAGLVPGAQALGRAYQKVNFLRDFASDYADRGRIYFPGVSRQSWNNAIKDRIAAEIRQDFAAAQSAIKTLPAGARTSVYLSFLYYRALLARLEHMSADQILHERAHVPTLSKLGYLVFAPIGARLS